MWYIGSDTGGVLGRGEGEGEEEGEGEGEEEGEGEGNVREGGGGCTEEQCQYSPKILILRRNFCIYIIVSRLYK